MRLADYAPGMRVIIRGEEWMIRKVETNLLGNRALYTTGVTPLVKDREAVFLTDLEEVEIVNPAEVRLVPDTSPNCIRGLLYIESQWRQKIPTDEKLHIGHLAAMDPLPYQLDPAAMALAQTRARMLIGDATGLGKTLEGAVTAAELMIRGKGKRILVVTAKSMMAQFQKEFWNRFTIPLVRLDSRRIQKIRASLPSNYNPFFYYDKTIISVDTLKRDVEYRTHLENAWWDLIIIDEAQNVAERGNHQAQRARLAKLLADRSDSLIMLSATPHDGRAKSFASLMNMLDPTAIANPEDYTREDIQGLCIRRFKEDIRDQVADTFPERVVKIEECQASEWEDYTFGVFEKMELQMDLGKTRMAGMLFKTSLEKAMFSSPAACIKSIEERLKKLKKKYTEEDIGDIEALESLRSALEHVEVDGFSRYQHLLKLLRGYEYGWNPDVPDDRLVIFTERIETMKFLAANLRHDLHLRAEAVQEISGAMSDVEQQKIVEDFGRLDSPVRILVASDVASEGLNLHYLCHRMIHFDIPWSLMVFQQRNGRIDRYGQKKRPDIRYLITQSGNERIRGDMRIIRILIEKEEQALKNIGDPALLMGLFDRDGEELVVAKTIEMQAHTPDVNVGAEQPATAEESETNPWDAMMEELLKDSGLGNDGEAEATPAKKKEADNPSFISGMKATVTPETVTDTTLFSNLRYLKEALLYLNRTDPHPFDELPDVQGLDIRMTPELERRLRAVIPEEAMPEGQILRLSADRRFCMAEMSRSMQNGMDERVWPATQYLWALHPIFTWINDKCRLLFQRGEAPVLGILNRLQTDEVIFLCAGSIPNRKSTPLVDEWFALRYRKGIYESTISMEQVVDLCGLDGKLANVGVSEEQIAFASGLRVDAVSRARKHLKTFYDRYQATMGPKLDEEVNKLARLETLHKDYQLSLTDNERKREEAVRRVDHLFDSFVEWVTDSLTIQDNPYIRIEAVLMGVTL